MSGCEPHKVITFEQILQGALEQFVLDLSIEGQGQREIREEEVVRANEYLNDPEVYRRTAVGYNDSNEDVGVIEREEMYDMRVTFGRIKPAPINEPREDQPDVKMEVRMKSESLPREHQKTSLKKDQKSNDSSDKMQGSGTVSQQGDKKQQMQKKKSSSSQQQHVVPPGWTIIKHKKTDSGSSGGRAFQSPDGIVFQSLQSAYYYWTNELNQVHPIQKEDNVDENVTIEQLRGEIRRIGVHGLDGGYIRSWEMKKALDKVRTIRTINY
eukprot:TRINITY_DN4354_c0_g1_i4.p1 TRINITY_DN4354_c0_g1~~TRINITY_DN4354_c0_g1_i4.p1  ORF type:complete len:292 (-),score=30.78 TRINITY_DN4354_c0_g1_i4:228-1031(-)